jgi:hypothetical protein
MQLKKVNEPLHVVAVPSYSRGRGTALAGQVELEPDPEQLELLHPGGAGFKVGSHEGLQK